MSNHREEKVYLVTGFKVALDNEGGILIAGILSDSPFNSQQDSISSGNLIGNFALTRQQATFLRDRLNEFLKEEK